MVRTPTQPVSVQLDFFLQRKREATWNFLSHILCISIPEDALCATHTLLGLGMTNCRSRSLLEEGGTRAAGRGQGRSSGWGASIGWGASLGPQQGLLWRNSQGRQPLTGTWSPPFPDSNEKARMLSFIQKAEQGGKESWEMERDSGIVP